MLLLLLTVVMDQQQKCNYLNSFNHQITTVKQNIGTSASLILEN